jgi:hypothetical protein
MKRVILMLAIIIVSLSGCMALTGCGEEFAAGMGVGAILAEDANNDLLESIVLLNAKTAEINEQVMNTEGLIVIQPETMEAIRNLKGREKDPVTWIALASIIVNAFAGGKFFTNRKNS